MRDGNPSPSLSHIVRVNSYFAALKANPVDEESILGLFPVGR